VVAQKIASGELDLKPCQDKDKVYVYHDPCYLGRHNGIYEDPRQAIDAIDGLTRVELEKSRDRSFCCGGGGLMLFYEPEEETRMGVSIKNIQEWHTWLQKYFKEGVNKKTLKRLSKFYEQPKLEENIIKSFNELDKNPLIKKDLLHLTENIISLVKKE
jgi:hypothetical protein